MAKRRDGPYTRGEINAIIDSIVHPFMKEYPWLRFVDGALHALNEQNPQESLEKFIRYHGPDLLEDMAKWLRRRR